MAKQTTAKTTSSMDKMLLASQGEQSQPSLTKKELGAFYTPSALASLLAKWAIRSREEHILEPGFGGCGFLQAAVDRLTTLGCSTPKNQLYGCDIDPQAFEYLSEKLGVLSIAQRYILSDFVTVSSQDFSVQAFDVVLGNPPYVSLHNMTASQRITVQAWKEKTGVKINGRASLWAYFVLHAMSFLKPGGRMAWVLPGAFLEADYATSLRANITAYFGKVVAIQLTERMFLSVGAEERTVVLLCSNFGSSSKEIKVIHCTSAHQLNDEMSADQLGNETSLGLLGPTPQLQNHQNNISVYDQLLASPDVVSLGDLCKVLIGTVTGANRFFIMSPSRATKHRLGERYLKPILAKFAHIQGAQINEGDINDWQSKDKPHLLFNLPDLRLSQAAVDYIASFPAEERENNSTFRRRNDWLRADDGRIPDAFLSYMMHDGPRMVLNNAAINATNSIHRVFFHQAVTPQKRKLIVISLCSTFSQLSAEHVGRSYGSGVLKIEPSEANRMSLILPANKTNKQIDEAFNQIDTCYRQGNPQKAQQVADKFLFASMTEADYDHQINTMIIELETARNRRRRQRDDI